MPRRPHPHPDSRPALHRIKQWREITLSLGLPLTIVHASVVPRSEVVHAPGADLLAEQLVGRS